MSASRPPVPRPPRATMKTYSHLAGARRLPTEYELATTGLLYYPRAGFEVDVPLAPFYERNQRGSSVRAADPFEWDRFVDPRETTYSRYVERQARREAFVDELLERIETGGYDARLGDRALAFLDEAVAPLRYPGHGLQMLAAYVGQMAPGGRIAIVAALQAADEMRRVQRLAYRMAQLRRVRPTLGDGSRALWETGPAWQPLREVIERLLVTWDFGEAFAALCLCLKPILDPLVAAGFGAEAHARGDYLLAEILASLDEDARWHHDWARALVGTAIALRPENRAGLADAVARWSGPCARAAVALGGLLVEIGPAGPALADGYAAFLEPLGLGLPWIEALEVLRSWR